MEVSMRNIWKTTGTAFAVAAFGLALSPAPAGAQLATLAIGKPAPAFSAPTADGKTASLADYKGKTVVLEWTNNGCPFVRAAYDSGMMQRVQAAAKAQGVVWLTVNSSAPGQQGHLTAEQAKADIAKEKASSAAYLLDPEGRLGKSYGAKTTPHMYVIDAKGDLQYNGAIDDKASAKAADHTASNIYVDAALKNVLAGKAADPATTTPYGCSVKYAT
jgi:peroxiredoxin